MAKYGVTSRNQEGCVLELATRRAVLGIAGQGASCRYHCDLVISFSCIRLCLLEIMVCHTTFPQPKSLHLLVDCSSDKDWWKETACHINFATNSDKDLDFILYWVLGVLSLTQSWVLFWPMHLIRINIILWKVNYFILHILLLLLTSFWRSCLG